MTQQLADLTERGALTQQLGGQSMTKLVCSVSGSVKAGAQEAMPNDRSDARGTSKAVDGGFGA